MGKINFNYLSNSEINIKLKELENEYQAKQNKIRDIIQEMNEIDVSYTEGKKLLEKRTKGFIV